MRKDIPAMMTCVLIAAFISTDINAQRSRKKKDANTSSTSPTDQNAVERTQEMPVQSSGYNPYAGLPIKIDTSGVLDNSSKKSLRDPDAFKKDFLNSRIPLPYEHLRWDDALYAEKVWREIDLREKMNQPFRYDAQDDNGSQLFINILLKAVRNGDVEAFEDDRFTTPLTVADIQQKTQGAADTIPVFKTGSIETIESWLVVRSSFDPKSVTKLRIKEEWVFDRESSRMFCRILGIGVLKTEYNPETKKERGTSSLFWVNYPELRPTLARYEIYNAKNMGQSRMTWEELFESRMFSSYIVKSTIDNPSNKMIRNYIKDPILALLEGDNIKEKMFNFEQDLWSY